MSTPQRQRQWWTISFGLTFSLMNKETPTANRDPSEFTGRPRSPLPDHSLRTHVDVLLQQRNKLYLRKGHRQRDKNVFNQLARYHNKENRMVTSTAFNYANQPWVQMGCLNIILSSLMLCDECMDNRCFFKQTCDLKFVFSWQSLSSSQIWFLDTNGNYMTKSFKNVLSNIQET